MIVTSIDSVGNSSKFHVVTNNGEFTIALSFTLRTKVWELQNADVELAAAQELAEAIVSRHNPKYPFKEIYILGEHNTKPSLELTVSQIRKSGFN